MRVTPKGWCRTAEVSTGSEGRTAPPDAHWCPGLQGEPLAQVLQTPVLGSAIVPDPSPAEWPWRPPEGSSRARMHVSSCFLPPSDGTGPG